MYGVKKQEILSIQVPVFQSNGKMEDYINHIQFSLQLDKR